jgi:hypothetical protein
MISAIQDPSNWLDSGKPDAILFSGGGNDVAGDQFAVFLDYAGFGAGGLDANRFKKALGIVEKPQTFEIDELRVALHGQSFRQRDITDNLVPAYPSPLVGCFNIGVLHTGLGGADGHANYAPCAMEDLTNKGYDYWALAHSGRRSP